jgi:hypothetical protein
MGAGYAGVVIGPAKSGNVRLTDRRSIRVDVYREGSARIGTLLLGSAGIAWVLKGKRPGLVRTVPYEELAARLG